MTIWRTRFACWITEATVTHSEYVLVIALPRQQWLHECVSVLRYTFVVCLSLTVHIVALFSCTRSDNADISRLYL